MDNKNYYQLLLPGVGTIALAILTYLYLACGQRKPLAEKDVQSPFHRLGKKTARKIRALGDESKKTARKIRALGDEILHDVRLRPVYRQVRQKAQYWDEKLKGKYRRLKQMRQNRRRRKHTFGDGDGLKSIFSPATLPTKMSTQVSVQDFNAIQDLKEHPKLAFQALSKLQVFGGHEVPFLLKMSNESEVVNFPKGHYLWKEKESLPKDIYILKSGAIEYFVSNGDQQHKIGSCKEQGYVCLSMVDLLAMIVDEPARCCVSIRCTENTKFIKVPAAKIFQKMRSAVLPGKDITSAKWSQVSTQSQEAYNQLLRMILIRINRVSMTTVYIHLKLIQYISPPKFVTPIPMGLAEDDWEDSPVLTNENRQLIKSAVADALNLPSTEHLPDIEFEDEDFSDAESVGSTDSEAGVASSGVARSMSWQEISMHTPKTPHPKPLNAKPGKPEEVSHIELVMAMKGERLVSPVGAACYLVLTGSLLLKRSRDTPPTTQETEEEAGNCTILKPGSLVGLLSLFTHTYEWYGSRSTRSFLELRGAENYTWVARISQACYNLISKAYPEVAEHQARKTIKNLPPLLRIFDFGTNWVNLNAGQSLNDQGDLLSQGLYVVLHGRLRMALEKSGASQVVGEYGRGMLLAESKFKRENKMERARFQAIRHCSLAQVPGTVLSYVMREHPQVLSILTNPITETFSDQPKNLFIVPISASVPLNLFCRNLSQGLQKIGQSTRILSSSSVASKFSLDDESAESAFDEIDLALGSWLSHQEEQHEVILFQADMHPSSWNSLCSKQADRIVLVANAADQPSISELEQDLNLPDQNALTVLVMIHVNPAPLYLPTNTRAWIEQRKGINLHHHIRLYTLTVVAQNKDFLRLARCLTGRAIGVVLGGGGARGMAHLGVLRALEEENIPVDYICGTSMGAFIGCLYARSGGYLGAKSPCIKYASAMGNNMNYLKDFTIPLVSYFSGKFFNKECQKALGVDTKIEDLWLNFFCMTVDLTMAKENKHMNGTAWRYVRASMSLAGYLPPMCDVESSTGEVHYLLDGGYLNNIPADQMKQTFSPKTIIAVDVNSHFDLKGDHYGDYLSGASILFNKLNPWAKKKVVPTFADISDHLTFLSYCKHWDDVRDSGVVDILMEPPIKEYGILDFHKSSEIEALAYSYAQQKCAENKGVEGGGLSETMTVVRKKRFSQQRHPQSPL